MATKQPQDRKPKATPVKEVEPHDPSEKFVYTSRDGSLTFHLPYLENLTGRQVKKLKAAEDSGEDPDEVLFSMLLSPEEFERVDDLTLLDQKYLMEQWNAESAVQLGNS